MDHSYLQELMALAERFANGFVLEKRSHFEVEEHGMILVRECG